MNDEQSVCSRNSDQHFDQDDQALVSKIDQLEPTQQCRSFDFNQCSLDGLGTDRFQIFELENQEVV